MPLVARSVRLLSSLRLVQDYVANVNLACAVGSSCGDALDDGVVWNVLDYA